MTDNQLYALLAAFCAFAACLVGFLAYGFYQMDAGMLPMFAAAGAVFCLMGVREFVGFIDLGEEMDEDVCE